jgi:hypothetical protein
MSLAECVESELNRPDCLSCNFKENNQFNPNSTPDSQSYLLAAENQLFVTRSFCIIT